ncbi:MAG: bifunctional UDP-N-acetylglucosamine diphosphorylase/glucosamine-1-phosphate N-acetyltransferase GlmU [Gammaproteobacteria bacterium]
MSLSIVILAAGEGSRMRSALPKVLHPLAGKPLLEHVVSTACELAPQRILVVYGHGGEQVRERLSHLDVTWVKQASQLGTGHAVQQCLEQLPAGDTVLVLYGDVPLISPETLQRLLAGVDEHTLMLLTARLTDPSGYGRIVRDNQGAVQRIVEDKDASPEERAIQEINTGILALHGNMLKEWLTRLDNDNAQGEYYLTDIIAMAVNDGLMVCTAAPASEWEIQGINNRIQLAALERHHQRCQAEALMAQGVTLMDPARIDIRGELQAGRDSVLDVNSVLEGRVVLGARVTVGPNVYLRDATIGDDVTIFANCVIEEAEIGAACQIGPFARIRPGTVCAPRARVGNFVEIKNSIIGDGSKVNHLSYIGDTTMGQDVNIGAGTITCNYDGANKHRTVIGDRAFIGSDTQLVAPVTVGEGATIGAGSTITRDAPPGELTLSRAPQKTRNGWQRPAKKRNE